MSSFTEPLRFENTDLFQSGRRIYRTTRPLTYYVGKLGSSESYTVPAGYLTDLASIPALFRGFFAPDGPYAAAAVLHDWLYESRAVKKSKADRIFFEAMGVLDIPMWRRVVMYAAVAVFGGRK